MGTSPITVTKRLAAAAVAAALAVGITGCPSDSASQPDPQKKQAEQIERQAKARQPYTPVNDVEFHNFNRAQELYDSPTTIIWCTAIPSNPNAPFITTPIQGKLTSSSVSYRRQQELVDHGNYMWSVLDAKSSDGMFHGSPPPYRYGFTPGGVYVDYTEIPTFCTTQLTKFQRESSKLAVTVDTQAKQATEQAEAALKNGDPDRAQEILSTLDSGASK